MGVSGCVSPRSETVLAVDRRGAYTSRMHQTRLRRRVFLTRRARPEHHEQTTVAANTPAVFLSPPIELHLLAKNTLHSPIDIAGMDAPVVGVFTFLPLSRSFRCSLGNIHLPSYVPPHS